MADKNETMFTEKEVKRFYSDGYAKGYNEGLKAGLTYARNRLDKTIADIEIGIEQRKFLKKFKEKEEFRYLWNENSMKQQNS